MAVRVAINGFGRIGRHVLRAAFESGRKDIKFVAINDLGSIEMNAHMLKHDSVHGAFPGKIRVTKSGFDVGQGQIRVLAESDPTKLPWRELDIDVVLECTGRFTSKETTEPHLHAGARKVLISAPASGVDLTVVFGVNEDKLNGEHRIVSNASCTTNCLAPVAAVLHGSFGIEQGYMTTVHAYTSDQRLVDTLHKDARRARAAPLSMIPTTTGAARAVGLVLPELKGKLDGTAIRVPVPNVSVIDFKFMAKKPATVEAINEAVVEASKSNRLKGILEVTDEELVSTDFNHSAASSTFDLTQTQVIESRFVRVLAWYDNEWGFANRMADVAALMGRVK